MLVGQGTGLRSFGLLFLFADPVAQGGFLHAEKLADFPASTCLGDVAFLQAFEVHAHRAVLRGCVVLTGSCHAIFLLG
ncbi:hypothetical protein DHOM_11440 [Dermabacter hominis 1368]|uniref:Secreted protein n=1 Tax=Dermabacter hominis 1368 TaxID=1450519 RepID=A0ABR4SI97_9MICO|nr:hypothetical protein DHOM_11440 [Dermabacter hominis 1368]